MNRHLNTFPGIRAANHERLDYFGHGDLENGWNVAEWGCALAGEVGELCNVLKKMHRAAPFDPSSDELLVAAGEEIADVYLYLDLLSQKLGLNIERCVLRKFNKTSEQYNFPVRITDE